MSVVGRVEEIWLWPVRRGDPQPVQAVAAMVGRGLEGDRARSPRRQVTLVSRESWAEATSEIGCDAPPRARRANLVVSGFELAETIGATVCIGEVTVAILGETEPCERMDEVCEGLRAALVPKQRGGVYGQIIVAGTLRPGDAIFRL